MASCSCNYHLKKVQSKCGFTTKVDTLTLHDTIKTERTIKDTLFKHTKDTVVLKQNNLTVKYFYNTKDSTIYLQGKCDTVIKVITKKIPVSTTNYNPNFFGFKQMAFSNFIHWFTCCLCFEALINIFQINSIIFYYQVSLSHF